MFDLSLYNDEFFEWHLVYARDYQLKTFSWFLDKYKPRSVIDFGCGIGSYLEVAFEKEILVKGYDVSEFASKYTPPQLRQFIEYTDCTKRIELKKYDCVLSFETAEHIQPEGTDQFVDNLKRAMGKYILFTGAPPGQDGCGHINLQPREYWIEKFNLPVDEEMTKDVSDNWAAIGCPTYISQNLIVFKK